MKPTNSLSPDSRQCHLKWSRRHVCSNVRCRWKECFEIHIAKLHVCEDILDGQYIDPLRWRPLLMSFCRFFALGEEVHSSRLAVSGFMNAVQPPSS